MRISRPKTERWHNYEEGDVPRPTRKKSYYKKGFWKRRDRKRFLREAARLLMRIQQ